MITHKTTWLLVGLMWLAISPACAPQKADPAGGAPPVGAYDHVTESNIGIELNKVEYNGGSCLASFVVQNNLGHTLDPFSLDLFVFDRDGIIARQVLLDLAPLGSDKTTVAKFRLIERPCAEISRVLINNIPSCQSKDTGETHDCLSGLTVSSRSHVELVK